MANNEYVNKVLFGDTTVMDISDTTAEEGDVIEGQTFYTRSGAPATGSLGDATTSAHGLMSANDKIKLDSLSTVATSGDYDDLSNKPDLSGYITSVPTMTGATSNADGTAGLIPAPTTADEEKFFRGDGTWQDGGRPMVILSYGSSTWQDFMDAYTHNVIVYCRASSNSNPASGQQLRMAFMAYVAGNASNPTEVEFQYYRSVNSHSLTQQGDQVFVYKLNNKGTWSVIVRQASSKIVAGNNMSVTYSTDTLTVASTLESKAAAASGTDISLVTTGEKAIWNNKADIEDIPTATSDLTNDSGYLIMSDLTNKADLDANGKVLSTQLPDSLDKNQGSENAGKFMKVGSDGNLVPDNVPDPSNKADKVTNATAGNFAGLDATGNLTDSGSKASDFMTRSSVVDLVYPVGSIYMSVTSTSPATLFGGTWQQLKDRFLIGTGNTYSNGATGGAASVSYTPAGTNSGGAVSNHTLTVDEIPSHNHSFTGSEVSTGNQSAGHTHKYTDYYATTTGNTAITVAQTASHSHYHVSSSATIQVSSSTSTSYGMGDAIYGSGGLTMWKIGTATASAGSGNNHNHSGANTSTTRTSEGISANHTHKVTASGSIGNKGGGKAHNHGFTQPTFTGTKATINTMPPYLTVYMWKRTA